MLRNRMPQVTVTASNGKVVVRIRQDNCAGLPNIIETIINVAWNKNSMPPASCGAMWHSKSKTCVCGSNNQCCAWWECAVVLGLLQFNWQQQKLVISKKYRNYNYLWLFISCCFHIITVIIALLLMLLLVFHSGIAVAVDILFCHDLHMPCHHFVISVMIILLLFLFLLLLMMVLQNWNIESNQKCWVCKVDWGNDVLLRCGCRVTSE